MMRFVVPIVVIVVLGVGALWLLQRRLIYLPTGKPGAPPPGWEDITVTTADGLELTGWYRPPEAGAGVVVVFNGNAGNRAGRTDLGEKLAANGLGVVLFDYRGYGGNPGSPTEEGLAVDATAVAEWVAQRHPDHPVVYFGESLGAAVAIRLAAERPPVGLVLRSPFTSLADIAAVHYPFLPVRSLLWDEYRSIDRIGSVRAPVTVIAGSADSIVPIDQSRAVYEAASDPKEWVVVEGADHNDVHLAAGDRVVAAVVEALG